MVNLKNIYKIIELLISIYIILPLGIVLIYFFGWLLYGHKFKVKELILIFKKIYKDTD
jgi:multidrug transporter EmrE-like cation transporter